MTHESIRVYTYINLNNFEILLHPVTRYDYRDYIDL